MATRVLSLGEALIDVVIRPESTDEHVGGSLLNVAVGIATLGQSASICAYWGRDDRGDRLRKWAESAGVEIVTGTDSAERTSVAFAHIDGEGHATYEFELTWKVPRVPDLSEFGHLHTGSIAATLEPGGADVVATATRMKEHSTVSYDPNIRPALMNSPDDVIDRVEHMVGLSDVVKASDEDLGWLYPDTPIEDVMRRWISAGPAMVVVTRGPWGAYALLANNRDMLHLDQLRVDVGDTVGAGDSFMAGLISGLLDAGLLGSPQARRRLAATNWSDVQPTLHRAVITSALTVSRSGAYAPTMAEVEAFRAADPTLR
ncbi:MAG: carbohydrate kinase [Actinobacteria bacterium]|nr:carbohydrate kinase [Actinomycetota bacterium]